jgi:aldose 1-epimerase
MEVWTTEPGVQFYSGNFLDGSITGKRGVVYGKHSGFCLETQHFPNAVNQPAFPSVILRPPAVYSTQTIYKFSGTGIDGAMRLGQDCSLRHQRAK